MTLRRLRVSDFRCLQSAEVDFDPRFTLITGQNASGKTSLLEAIYVLGRGRSFRSRHLGNLIREGADRFVVFGDLTRGERSVGIGVEGSVDGVRARMGGDRVQSLADLAALLPVQVIDPEVHRLIEEGPGRRRRFMDWGVFHVEHGFVGDWQQYQHVLKQRNSALRQRLARTVVTAWDGELLRLGSRVESARRLYVETLEPVAVGIVRALLSRELSFSYRPGWIRDRSFEEALAQSWPRDWEAGLTGVGPQRAELAIRLDGASVKDRISRGQQKLLAAGLLLAQIRLLPQGDGGVPTLLLDDPAAELDSSRLLRLIREVTRDTVQLVVTSLREDFESLGEPGRRYGVVAGRVAAI